MVTAEEVARIAIFADLGLEERGRIARAAADISLSTDEYAAEPKAERALFGLLEGRIHAVRIDDGIPTVVGERVPGDIFGEVPITLGTVFPVGFRPPSRPVSCGSTRTGTTPSRPSRPSSSRSTWPPAAVTSEPSRRAVPAWMTCTPSRASAASTPVITSPLDDDSG